MVLEDDEYPRSNTTLEGPALLEPAFAALGATPTGFHAETLDQIALQHYPQAGEICYVHTAGNSSGIVDGAAGVLLASEEYVQAYGFKPRARVRTIASSWPRIVPMERCMYRMRLKAHFVLHTVDLLEGPESSRGPARGSVSPCIGYLDHPFEKEAPWAFTARLFFVVR